VASHDWPDPPSPGSSIAVNGCCLTLLAWAGGGDNALHFDVVPQTLDRTTLGSLGEGASVNLEPALRADQRLDGHLVQGHVDGVGTVAKVVREGEYRLAISAPPEVAPYLSERGSITVDGVSLTIAAVDGAIFEVALIPATLESTTLGDLQEGMVVNLEADAFAKLVAQHVKRILGQQQR
jgi:riboflavin synthase